MPWQSPTLTVKWGSFFAPDAADEKMIVDTVVAAAPYTTERMRMEKLAPIFSIENVEAALADLEEEKQAELDTEESKADAELERTKVEIDATAKAKAATQKPAPGGFGAKRK